MMTQRFGQKQWRKSKPNCWRNFTLTWRRRTISMTLKRQIRLQPRKDFHMTSTAAGLMTSGISTTTLSIHPLCRPLYFRIPRQWMLHLWWPILLVLAIRRVAIVGHMLRLKHPAQHLICFSSPRITLGLGNENTTIPLYTTFSSLSSFLIVCALRANFFCVCARDSAVRAWKLCMHVVLIIEGLK